MKALGDGRRFVAAAVEARGLVVDIANVREDDSDLERDMTRPYPVVEFVTAREQVLRYQTPVGSNPPDYRLGGPLKVLGLTSRTALPFTRRPTRASAASATRSHGPRQPTSTASLPAATNCTRVASSPPAWPWLRKEVNDLGGPTVEYGGNTAGSPAVQPMLCRLPPGANSPHAATSSGPPTLSKTTSTGWSTPSRPTTTSSAPASAKALAAGWRADRGDHLRTRVCRQLHGEPTNPAGGAGDQHPLAQDRAGSTQGPQRGNAGHRQRRRLGQINRGWDLGQRTDLDRAALGERPWRQGHDAGPGRWPAAIGRGLRHHPGRIRPQHPTRRHPAGAGVIEIPMV